MTKDEVKTIINSELKSFYADSLDKEMAKKLRMNNTASRNELIATIRDSIENVVKVLWQKKTMWTNDIK
jgi:hypothetical protein